MNQAKIYEYLNNGGTITVSASGVTFPSTLNPNEHRQDTIRSVQETLNIPLTLTFEPDNPYDQYAIRIDYNGKDMGYIPAKSSIEILTSRGTPKRLFDKLINKILCEYDKPLKAQLSAVYGGYNGKHLGFSVSISKSD